MTSRGFGILNGDVVISIAGGFFDDESWDKYYCVFYACDDFNFGEMICYEITITKETVTENAISPEEFKKLFPDAFL